MKKSALLLGITSLFLIACGQEKSSITDKEGSFFNQSVNRKKKKLISR